VARELTPGEARVIADALAGGAPVPGSPRYGGLSRSTYVVARRRVFREGWVYDRYVPDPALLRFHRVRLQLARPFAEGLHELSVRWRTDPGVVVLWRHPSLLFGVFFDTRGASNPETEKPPVDGGRGYSSLHVVSGDPAGPLLPVYFDHEAIWSRLAGTAGPVAFPRSLGGAFPPSKARDRLAGFPAFPSIVRELLDRTPVGPGPDRPAHLRGPFGLPRSRQRVLELGFVQRRVFVDFARVPPVGGRQVKDVLLLHARLRPGATAGDLFRDLVGEARVSPFLLAHHGDSVLLGALAFPPRESAAEAARDRARPLEVLQRHLRELDPFWADVQGLDVLVDHAYDRLEVPGA
jgi:hypothetical protein